ncbi:Crp/Fnr family transcriptional regulator [Polaribacter gochangensis]|uniref:Crp/Fnr family transcriptional regulator n=1 Tax=Polaribacter gochangensis TaxID=3252903 RepID=UPI00390473E3
MDFVSNFINTYSPNLSKKSRVIFESNIQFKFYKKGDIIVNAGEIPTNFYILKTGVLRSFLRDSKGKEHIKTIYIPITTSGSLSSLITKKPSNAIYDCLTDAEILVGNFHEFIKQTEKHHDLALLYNRVLESIFIRTEKRIFELSVLNATERYIKLKKEIPNISNLIQQYHIASYLNITPVQLSRIRKELYSK